MQPQNSIFSKASKYPILGLFYFYVKNPPKHQ